MKSLTIVLGILTALPVFAGEVTSYDNSVAAAQPPLAIMAEKQAELISITTQQLAESLTETTMAEEPVAAEPVAEQPVAAEPVAEQPVAEQPVAPRRNWSTGVLNAKAVPPESRQHYFY